MLWFHGINGEFKTTIGVKQGGLLSLFLFSLFIYDLENYIDGTAKRTLCRRGIKQSCFKLRTYLYYLLIFLKNSVNSLKHNSEIDRNELDSGTNDKYSK